MTCIPKHSCTNVEEVLQIDHTGDRVKEETEKVGVGTMRNAVDSPAVFLFRSQSLNRLE